MKRTTQMAWTLAGAGALASGAWYMGWTERMFDQSNGAKSACETALLEALVSPSSYRRIESKFVRQGQLTLEEFQEAAETRQCAVTARSSISCESQTPTADAFVDQYMAEKQFAKEGIKILHPNRTQTLVALKRYREVLYKHYLELPAGERGTGSVTIKYDAENSFGASLRTSAFCRFGPLGSDGHFSKDDIILFSSAGEEL